MRSKKAGNFGQNYIRSKTKQAYLWASKLRRTDWRRIPPALREEDSLMLWAINPLTPLRAGTSSWPRSPQFGWVDEECSDFREREGSTRRGGISWARRFAYFRPDIHVRPTASLLRSVNVISVPYPSKKKKKKTTSVSFRESERGFHLLRCRLPSPTSPASARLSRSLPTEAQHQQAYL